MFRLGIRRLAAAWLIGPIALVASADAAEWPQFRGPDGQGHAEAKNLPDNWSETENITWRTEIPGQGWSSPVIEGNEIWMTTSTVTTPTEEEKQKKLAEAAPGQPLDVVADLSMRAVGVNRETGELLADVELMAAHSPDPIHAMNSHASPTPVIEDGKLYCHFGTNGTACIDTKTKKVVWTNQKLHIKHENGPGSSPILWKDLLIFHCDGSDEQYIVALDKRTGEIAWKTPRTGKLKDDPQLKKAYGTPLVINFGDHEELISPGADWLYSYDPATGKELWKLNYEVLGFSIVPRPVFGNGMIYFATSFMQSQILAVKYDGKGEPTIAWRFTKQAPQMPSPLLVDGLLYIVSERGVATCIDAMTGEAVWTERLGGNFAASPLLADGKIYFCNREGLTTVVAAGREFKRIAKNTLDGQHMASPIAIDNAFYLRTDKAMYRVEKK